MLSGQQLTSPSAQIEMRDDGDVHLLSTHEQLLGGSGGQTFAGCLFPARSDYAAELAGQALKVGKELAAAGARGRAAIDFVAVDDGSGWSVHALEVNLRKGGTTHPYTALRNLVPGRYDEQTGEWVADQDGRSRCYRARDAFLDPDFVGLVPGDVIAAVADAGLEFDRTTGTGVVLHMLGALAVDGRMGYVAIGLDRSQADELGAATEEVVRRLADRARLTGVAGAFGSAREQCLDPRQLLVELALLRLGELAEKVDHDGPAVLDPPQSLEHPVDEDRVGQAAVGAHPVLPLGRLGDPVAVGVGEPDVVVEAEQPDRCRSVAGRDLAVRHVV